MDRRLRQPARPAGTTSSYRNGTLVVASDIGVFTSADNGTTWNRLGTNLPNVVVGQITVDPNGTLVAATHGRGIWTIAAP